MTHFDYGKQYTESWKVNVVNDIIKLSFLHLKTMLLIIQERAPLKLNFHRDLIELVYKILIYVLLKILFDYKTIHVAHDVTAPE